MNDLNHVVEIKRGTPSFLRLFNRSHYLRAIAPEDKSDDAETERRERERFSVAALCFCLNQDSEFLEFFLDKICRHPRETVNRKKHCVELEPDRWADLKIVSQCQRRREVRVIECKAGARLENRQNPNHPEFMKPHHGYGWFMKDTERGLDTRLHYILLGAREHLRPVKPPSVSGIHVHQLKWAELNGCKSNPLLDDLFTSLGYLGVPGFLMEDAEKIKITTDFGPTGKAFDVLNALGSEAACGFRPSYWRVKAERPEPKLFNIGAYLHKPPPSKEISRLHRQLDAAVQPPGNLLLWTGYETGGDLIARRSVWFFCSNIVKPNNSALASNRTSRSNATGRFFAQSSQIPLTKMTWHGFRKYSEKPLNEKILTTI